MFFDFKKNEVYRALLIFVIFLAVVTRVCGISFGLPHLYHVDEARFAKISINYFTGDLNPHFFHVPSLHTYLVAGAWAGYYLIGKATGQFESIDHFRTAFNQDATIFMIIGRILTVILSIGTILIVYCIGSRMYSPRVGLLASVFLVFSPVHNKISHYMVPDVPMVFLLALSFLCIWMIYAKGDVKFYILAGLIAGLGTAMKYGGQMLFLPLFLAHLFHILDNKKPIKSIFLSPGLVLSVIFFLGGFLAGCPYAIIDFARFWKDFRWQSLHLLQAGHYGSSTTQPAWLFYILHGLKENIGTLIQFLFYGGVVYGLFRHKKRELILIVFPLVLFVFIGSWKSRAVRYLLPLTPFMALISAYFLDVGLKGLSSLFKKFSLKHAEQSAYRGALNGMIILILLAPNVVKILRFDILLIHKDTRTIAKEWVESNIPKGSRIAMESYCPPLSDEYFNWTRRHTLGNVNLEWLSQHKVEYIIVSDIMFARFLRSPDEFPKQSRFYRSLDKHAVLIRTFKPRWDEHLIDLHNPTIKIYRLSQYPNYRFPGNFAQYAQKIDLVKTENGKWRLHSSVRYCGYIDADEHVKNPYVRIIDAGGKEILRVIVHDGKINQSESASSTASPETFPLSDENQIYIGYEYDLLGEKVFSDKPQTLRKEFLLTDRIESKSLFKKKHLEFLFLYTAFPDTRGDDYFQVVTFSKISAAWTISSTVFGGEFRSGDDFVLNPFVQITDPDGSEKRLMTVFNGKLGSVDGKRKAIAKKSVRMASLPEDFRVFVGYEYYFDPQYADQAGGPEVVEIIRPSID